MKKLLVFLGVVLFLLIGGALLAPYFISGEQFRARVEAQAEKSLGHKLTIGGKLSLKFFPVAGVSMENVTLSGPLSDGDRGPLATVKALAVDVEVMPLLHGDVRVKSLVLDEPIVHLKVDASGKNNWRFEPRAVALESGWIGEANAAEDDNAQMLATLDKMHLSAVKVKNGTVSYRNAQTKDQWDVNGADAAMALEGSASPFSLKGSVEWNKKPVKFDVQAENLQAFFGRGTADVAASVSSEALNLDAKGAFKNQVFSGNAAVNSPSLRDAMGWLQGAKIVMSAPLALDLKSGVQCSKTNCVFSKADVKLDKIEAKGEVKVSLAGKVPLVDVNVTTGKLDVNPFLPEEKKASLLDGLVLADAQAAGWAREPIDFSAFRTFDANAVIAAEGILVRHIVIGKTVLKAKLAGGKLAANIDDAAFYNGKASIDLTMDAAVTVPVFTKQVTIKGVQAEPFLKDAADSDRLSGTGELQGNFTSHGKSEQEIISNLNGSGFVKVTDGAVKGINLADMVRNIQSAFQKSGGSQKTDFTEMGGTFTIAQGIVSNKDLSMKAPLMRLSGAGQVDLPQQTIHYRLTPQIVGNIEGQGGKDSAGIGVPVMIEGSLENPTYRPDVAAAVQDLVNDPKKLKETVKDLKGQFKGTGKGFKNLLKGF